MTRGFGPGAASAGRVRLRTLSNLRWLAVAGQSAVASYRRPYVNMFRSFMRSTGSGIRFEVEALERCDRLVVDMRPQSRLGRYVQAAVDHGFLGRIGKYLDIIVGV